MKAADLARAMESIAPLSLAEPWDNAGLIVGSAERALTGPVLLAIDLTEAVLAEAAGLKASAIVAYHPPIWDPIKRITDRTPKERVVLGAIEAGIAVYAPHTALDAAPEGLTDWLCEGISGGTEGKIAGDCRAIRPHVHASETAQVKVVTFVPESAVEAVRNALGSAGAGLIGEYRLCSFAAPGTGTFFGEDASSPAVGEKGRLEQVAELRLEMVCSRAALAIALETLRRFHPYEEPAIDVYELVGQPRRGTGLGRRLVLDQPATLATIAERLKRHLGITMVKVARAGGPDSPERSVTHIGVCAGSGADLAPLARADGCEAYVTGEMTHHQVLAELNMGMSVLLAGHTNTERGYLPRLARRLTALLPGVRVQVSRADKSPFVPV